MRILAVTTIGLASLLSAQSALADLVVTYDLSGYLFWHQTQNDGAPTALTGRATYDYTTNQFTQADVTVGPYQFSMGGLGAPYASSVVFNSIAIDQTTTCALPAGQTCPDGLASDIFVELGISPLQYGPTASNSYTGYGTVPFQFQALLGTNGPTPDGQKDFALYIGSGTVATVPEPGTCALVLAGLNLLGFAGRRKQTTA